MEYEPDTVNQKRNTEHQHIKNQKRAGKGPTTG